MVNIRKSLLLLLLAVTLTVAADAVNKCTYLKKGRLSKMEKTFTFHLKPYQMNTGLLVGNPRLFGVTVTGIEVAVCAPRASRVEVYFENGGVMVRRQQDPFNDLSVPMSFRFHVHFDPLIPGTRPLKSGLIGKTKGVCNE